MLIRFIQSAPPGVIGEFKKIKSASRLSKAHSFESELAQLMIESNNAQKISSANNSPVEYFKSSKKYKKYEKKMSELLCGKTKEDLRADCSAKICPDPCECVQRIKLISTTYKDYINSDFMWRNEAMGPLIEQKNYGYDQFYGDFLHVHTIHGKIDIGLKCDDRRCRAFMRHNRVRNQPEEKERELFFVKSNIPRDDVEFDLLQLCDRVHVFFLQLCLFMFTQFKISAFNTSVMLIKKKKMTLRRVVFNILER